MINNGFKLKLHRVLKIWDVIMLKNWLEKYFVSQNINGLEFEINFNALCSFFCISEMSVTKILHHQF